MVIKPAFASEGCIPIPGYLVKYGGEVKSTYWESGVTPMGYFLTD